MLLAYRLTCGNLGLSLFVFLGRFFLRFSDVSKSGGCESVCPSGFNVDIVGSVDSEQEVTSRIRPGFPRRWRKVRWFERRGIASMFHRFSPVGRWRVW